MASPREKLADFAALCLWLFTSTALAVIAYLEYGQDFRGYYAAARVLLENGNPYDYNLVAPVLLDATGRVGNNPFYYPLWFGWFITPLSLLPFQAARAAWMVFNLLVWIVGLIRLRELLEFPSKGWRTWLMNIPATFLFGWVTFKFEQTGILLFALTVEILISYKRGQCNRMGIFLALALIKPNIMLLPVAAVMAWLMRNRIWQPVQVALALLAILILVTAGLTPSWYQPFFQAGFGQGLTYDLNGPTQVVGTRLNTTLLDWLKVMGVAPKFRVATYVVVVVTGLLILGFHIWRSKSLMKLAVTSLLVTFAITPYALLYDYPPLAIVLSWALAMSSGVESKAIPVIVTAFITSVIIWIRPISDGYWFVLGLAILTLWVERAVRKIPVATARLTESH